MEETALVLSAKMGKWYWNNPLRVARDRPTYRRYLPLLREIAQAGWRPLTLARSNRQDRWVERFGEGETVYLTLLNAGDQRRLATIALDPRLGLTSRARARELLSGAAVPWRQPAGLRAFDLWLAPEEVRVVRIGR